MNTPSTPNPKSPVAYFWLLPGGPRVAVPIRPKGKAL